MASFSIEAMVRGYHVYKHIWTAVVGEEFPCRREVGNTFDPFAVAVMRDDTVIGHVPRRISSICAMFLRREGSITCEVTDSRRHSDDLPQGGLEIPCVLRFEGGDKVTTKAKKLLKSILSTETVDLLAKKKRKVTDTTVDDSGTEVSKEWVWFGKGFVFSITDKEQILDGKKLMIITSTWPRTC